MVRAAAFGVRVHSGWAALVAVAGDAKSVEVVDRRRIEMTDPGRPLSKRPYHEAEELPVEKAAARLEVHSTKARELAARALQDVVADLRGRGYRVAGTGIVTASGRPLPRLEAILASHALIHAADGEHFRDALARASEQAGLPVTRIPERELASRAGDALARPAAWIQSTLATLGRGLGPPWTQDQKLAALAAWVLLA